MYNTGNIYLRESNINSIVRFVDNIFEDVVKPRQYLI